MRQSGCRTLKRNCLCSWLAASARFSWSSWNWRLRSFVSGGARQRLQNGNCSSTEAQQHECVAITECCCLWPHVAVCYHLLRHFFSAIRPRLKPGHVVGARSDGATCSMRMVITFLIWASNNSWYICICTHSFILVLVNSCRLLIFCFLFRYEFFLSSFIFHLEFFPFSYGCFHLMFIGVNCCNTT